MKHLITTLALLLCASTAQAAQPPCLPAVLAGYPLLPVGTPVQKNLQRPAWVVDSKGGQAIFWYCKTPAGIVAWEYHGTLKSIAAYGGSVAVQATYAKGRDAAFGMLTKPCSRTPIDDPDERFLCAEVMRRIKAEWPK